jgi:hypothetical protein
MNESQDNCFLFSSPLLGLKGENHHPIIDYKNLISFGIWMCFPLKWMNPLDDFFGFLSTLLHLTSEITM